MLIAISFYRRLKAKLLASVLTDFNQADLLSTGFNSRLVEKISQP